MEDIPHALSNLLGNARKNKDENQKPPRDLVLGAPVFGGILGAAQLSTALLLQSPASSTDIGISGAGGAYLLWTIPLGALLGVFVGRLILFLPRRLHTRSGVLRNWLIATIAGIFVAPMAPMFLGLAPQSQAELWRGLGAISAIVWLCIFVLAQIERRGIL